MQITLKTYTFVYNIASDLCDKNKPNHYENATEIWLIKPLCHSAENDIELKYPTMF